MKFLKKYAHILLLIIGAIFILLPSFHVNIWFDEAYSVAIAKHSFYDIWIIGSSDVHPVLYYVLLKIIGLCTNYSIMTYRLFSSLPIILLALLGYTHIRKDFNEKMGFIFSFLVYFIPVTLVYTNQIRMYSLAIFLSTLLFIYAYRISKGNDSSKNIIIFSVTSLLCIYTHYYSLMLAGIVNILLLVYLIKKNRKKEAVKIFFMGVVQFILYLPWLFAFSSQISNVSKGFWISLSFPKSLIELTSFMFLGNFINNNFKLFHTFIFVISCLINIYLIIRLNKLKKNSDEKRPIMAIILYIMVILSALIITLLMKSVILYYRYLFVITGLYLLSLSYVLYKEKNIIIKVFLYSFIVLISVINNICMMKNNYNNVNMEPFIYLKDNVKTEDVIVFKDVLIGANSSVYLENNRHIFYNYEKWNIYDAYKAFANMEIYDDISFLDDINGRIWFIEKNNSDYSLLFNNNYQKVIEKDYITTYQNLHYKIILVEKIKK